MEIKMDLIVAVYENWGIGKNGTQPVVVPEDRKHFRRVTGRSTVIVGDRTMADFPGGKPLKNRRNIVLSIIPDFEAEGAEVAHSFDEAMSLVREDEETFVIGGASIYRLFLPYCRRAYITMIYTSPDCDVWFPNLDELENWRVEDEGELREHEGLFYRFMTYVNTDFEEAEEEYEPEDAEA